VTRPSIAWQLATVTDVLVDLGHDTAAIHLERSGRTG
jgi:hypothetical protein